MLRSWPRAIVHIDCDAFFASCEQAMHPEWRGRAVITGKERGIVAAASYEAKAKGVSRGTPLHEVKRIIPDAIIVPSDYETYSLFSKRLFAIMRRFTPTVEEYSIDEAFADITGLRRTHRADYVTIARRMKTTIEAELGITVSVGIALSKVLAKIASKWRKPAGLTAIPGREIHSYLARTPTEGVWGIGPRTAAYCARLGIRTALDLARKPERYVTERFTRPHVDLWRELNGESVFEVSTEEKHSYQTISKTKTFTPPSADRGYVYAQLLKNAENGCIKARRHRLVASGIVAYLRRHDFTSVALEASFSRATAYPLEMNGVIRGLFDRLFERGARYRATGVILTGLAPEDSIQLSIFDRPVRLERLKRLYSAVDDLAGRMGKHAVFTAASAPAHATPNHVRERGDVPIRKLARLKGETPRLHLRIPLLMWKIN